MLKSTDDGHGSVVLAVALQVEEVEVVVLGVKLDEVPLRVLISDWNAVVEKTFERMEVDKYPLEEIALYSKGFDEVWEVDTREALPLDKDTIDIVPLAEDLLDEDVEVVLRARRQGINSAKKRHKEK